MSSTDTPVSTLTSVLDGTVGTSRPRPDGPPKTQGLFDYSSDLHARGMLWGATLRSTHPRARIRNLDIHRAVAMDGVAAVLTADDVPGSPTFGVGVRDQPVFASDVVRYFGEPIACVAAAHPRLAMRALAAIRVDYEVEEPLTDPSVAMHAKSIHPDGNVFRHLRIRHGDPDTVGDVVVEGTYTIGMQDQAFLGPEAALAIPDGDGGVTIQLATQDLHADHGQIADCLGLPPQQVRLVMSGIGGAFGAREDLSLQLHVALLALRTQQPVKMLYGREESFLGHVHRHPAIYRVRHHATVDGDLVKVEGEVIIDGGAYASTSAFVLGNATCFIAGPYRVPNAVVDGWAVRTNNPPAGAMRGFGTVQACFAHESQMDRLALRLGRDPIDLRLQNVVRPGDRFITGQRVPDVSPAQECLQTVAATPLPDVLPPDPQPAELPGGFGRTTDRDHLRRGIGYALSVKNVMFPEGFDDFSSASVRVDSSDGDVRATVRCAAAEVGQGFVTLAQQIVTTCLNVSQVEIVDPDSTMSPAGSSSASRQAWMSGGAIKGACEELLERLKDRAASVMGCDSEDVVLDAGEFRNAITSAGLRLIDVVPPGGLEASHEYHHEPTTPLDEDGQGDPHVAFAYAAHRAVVDVDSELGLVRVVEIATAQDVGKALNPVQVLGQIEGGISQGVGFAVMEELRIEGGVPRNPSFTDYLIPTVLDMPDVKASIIEYAQPGAPFGAKGVGEPPAISSTPAVVNAIRDAVGKALTRIPVRPEDIALGG